MLIFTMDFKLWHSAGPKGRSIPDSEGLMLIHDCKTLPFSYSTTNEERSTHEKPPGLEMDRFLQNICDMKALLLFDKDMY